MALPKFPFLAICSVEFLFVFLAFVLACVTDSKQHSWWNNSSDISDPATQALVTGDGIPDLYTFSVFVGAFGTITLLGLIIWTFVERVTLSAFLVIHFINWALFLAGFIQLATTDISDNCDVVSLVGGDLNEAFCTLPKALEAFFAICWILSLVGFIGRWIVPNEAPPTTETSENPAAEPKTV